MGVTFGYRNDWAESLALSRHEPVILDVLQYVVQSFTMNNPLSHVSFE